MQLTIILDFHFFYWIENDQMEIYVRHDSFIVCTYFGSCSSDHISFNKCEQIVTNGSVV